MSRNLFACPDCGNACSVNANSCPHCGGVLRSAPVYIDEPKKKTSGFTWLLLIAILVVPVLCCLSGKNNSRSPLTTTSKTPPANYPAALAKNYNPESRRKYAFGLEASIDSSKATIRNTRITAEGSDSDILVIEADGIGASDCETVAYGEYGKAAAATGFQKVTCQNRISGGEWSLVLPEPNF